MRRSSLIHTINLYQHPSKEKKNTKSCFLKAKTKKKKKPSSTDKRPLSLTKISTWGRCCVDGLSREMCEKVGSLSR